MGRLLKKIFGRLRRSNSYQPGPCVVCGAPPGVEIGSMCRRCWREMMYVSRYHAFILTCPCEQVRMNTMDAVTTEYERFAKHCAQCEAFQAHREKLLAEKPIPEGFNEQYFGD